MTKEKIDWRVVITGIIALMLLEMFALYQGVNGMILVSVMTLIGLVIGVTLPNPIKK